MTGQVIRDGAAVRGQCALKSFFLKGAFLCRRLFWQRAVRKCLPLERLFLLCMAEGVQDVRKGTPDRREGRVPGRDTAGKEHTAFPDGLQQLHLGRIVGVEAEDVRGEDHGVLIAVIRFGDDAVQLAGIDEIQAFGVDRVLFHIDVQTEGAAGKVQDLHLVMPVMLD